MKKNDENVDFEEIIRLLIYNAKDITTLNEIEQNIKNNIAGKGGEKLKTIFCDDFDICLSGYNVQDYEIFTQKLKNDAKLQEQIFDEIKKCRKYLEKFQNFYNEVYRYVSDDYNKSAINHELISRLQKFEDGILIIKKNKIRLQDFVLKFTILLKNYLHDTELSDYSKEYYYNIITVLQDMCPKYQQRRDDLRHFFEKLYIKVIENRFTKLPYLSQKYHKKYFKKACICFIGAFIWFIITSLPTYINLPNLPAGILGWININFKPTLKVNNEWLQYIVWITIKTPSIILAWIGLSYLRAADRHDQDAKELSNLYQYKSMITAPVTQDALIVALAPNYFGTKRNRKSDNNFMEKLLLKMIPTLNINAGGGGNNVNNGGQNGGQTHG